MEKNWQGGLAADELELDVADRAMMACDSFDVDTRGFTARANFGRERLVFFSVPWDKGWSATVNGKPVQIERANIGFMAVRVPAGEAVIRFDYQTPGLIPGAIASGASLCCWRCSSLWSVGQSPAPFRPRGTIPPSTWSVPGGPASSPGSLRNGWRTSPPPKQKNKPRTAPGRKRLRRRAQ